MKDAAVFLQHVRDAIVRIEAYKFAGRWQVVQLDATPHAPPRPVFAPLTFAARHS